MEDSKNVLTDCKYVVTVWNDKGTPVRMLTFSLITLYISFLISISNNDRKDLQFFLLFLTQYKFYLSVIQVERPQLVLLLSV